MLEDLLPLEDLHDPFLDLAKLEHEAAAQHPHPHAHHAFHVQQHGSAAAYMQALLEAGVDPSEPGGGAGGGLFSPTTSGFFGIPAYAEPDSPAAALLNNAAHNSPPPLPVSLAAAAFGKQHAMAAAAAVGGMGAAGLPPAIAAAQQRAAQVLMQQAAAAAQQQQPAPTANATSSGQGVSHLSNGSAGSAGPTATATTTAVLPFMGGTQRFSDDSSGGDLGGASGLGWQAAAVWFAKALHLSS